MILRGSTNVGVQNPGLPRGERVTWQAWVRGKTGNGKARDCRSCRSCIVGEGTTERVDRVT